MIQQKVQIAHLLESEGGKKHIMFKQCMLYRRVASLQIVCYAPLQSG
jgi:hypothetical protein